MKVMLGERQRWRTPSDRVAPIAREQDGRRRRLPPAQIGPQYLGLVRLHRMRTRMATLESMHHDAQRPEIVVGAQQADLARAQPVAVRRSGTAPDRRVPPAAGTAFSGKIGSPMAPDSYCNGQFDRKRPSAARSATLRRLKWRLVTRLLGTGLVMPCLRSSNDIGSCSGYGPRLRRRRLGCVGELDVCIRARVSIEKPD
jgi:hypothetical protein